MTFLRKRNVQFGPIQVIWRRSDLWKWLSENREKIASHVAHAIDELMDDQDTLTNLGVATEPLVMPDKLYRRRHRPANSHEEWLIFEELLGRETLLLSGTNQRGRLSLTLALKAHSLVLGNSFAIHR